MNKTLWMLAGPIRWNMLGSVIVGLCVTLSYVGQGVLLALALGAVFRAHDMTRAAECVGGLLVLVVVRGGLLWLAEIAAQTTAQRTKESMRERLLEKLIALGPSYANAQQSGKVQQTIVGGVEAIETYFSRYMPTVFVAIFGVLLVLLALAIIDPWSALVLVPFIVTIPVFSRTFQRWRRGRSRGLHAVRSEFGAYLLDSLQGLVTLKAFSATFRRRQVLVERAVELRQEAMKTLSVSLARGGVTGLPVDGRRRDLAGVERVARRGRHAPGRRAVHDLVPGARGVPAARPGGARIPCRLERRHRRARHRRAAGGHPVDPGARPTRGAAAKIRRGVPERHLRL